MKIITIMEPDKYQQPIIERLKAGKPNDRIGVNAVAGSGKSTLIKLASNAVDKNARVLTLAFNSHICKELEGKARGEVRTSHSHGLNALKTFKPNLKKADQWKYMNICADIANENFNKREDKYKAEKELNEIAKFCMLSLVDTSDLAAIQSCIELFGLDCSFPQLLGLVKEVEAEGLRSLKKYGEMDFIDMIYWPIKLDLPLQQFDLVMADEAQDFNAIQQEISKRSINAGGVGLWVYDPFQSMYGFAGALPNSCEKIIQMNNCDEMPLSYCYRCPTSHLDRARRMVPHIENAPSAIEGEFLVRQEKKLSRLVNSNTAVLCRFTAPLIKHCISLVTQRIKAYVKGNDICAGLEKLIEKIAESDGFTMRHFSEHLASTMQEELAILAKRKNQEARSANVQDRYAALDACYKSFKPATEASFKKELKELFSPKAGSVALSSIHRSKGLEYDDVIVIESDKSAMPVRFPNSLPWEQQQEVNIKYVSYTRAKRKLVKLISDNDSGDKDVDVTAIK